jgi:hypothetical protein
VLFALQTQPTDPSSLEDKFLADGLSNMSQDQMLRFFLKKSNRDKYSSINYLDRDTDEKGTPLYSVDSCPLPDSFKGDRSRVLKDPFQVILTDFGCGVYFNHINRKTTNNTQQLITMIHQEAI